MIRKQKRMGPVGCFGQIENIKRQSLIYNQLIRIINSIDKMKALMKEYFEITVPMLYYKNHGPFRLDIGMMPIKIHYALTVELK